MQREVAVCLQIRKVSGHLKSLAECAGLGLTNGNVNYVDPHHGEFAVRNR